MVGYMKIKDVLTDLVKNNISIDEADKLLEKHYIDLDIAKLDKYRQSRQGISEVIYAEYKTKEEIKNIINAFLSNGDKHNILITRLKKDSYNFIKDDFEIFYDDLSGFAVINPKFSDTGNGYVSIVSAGTSDMCVCNEAKYTLKYLGNRVETIVDVGVSGLGRLLSNIEIIRGSRAVIVIAGMEGALASCIAGLIKVPIIAVPTSVGYGASFHGVAALLGMLNSCSVGVSVVNIDNGFGAGVIASRINHI